MGDHLNPRANGGGNWSADDHAAATEPAVRTRWTPKPEQIMILESIFNGGMVNPPKDETVRIRKLLEAFGPVGDANVFYWFQNRRSRSRRRQRQMQAGTAGDPGAALPAGIAPAGSAGGATNSPSTSGTPSRGGVVSSGAVAAGTTDHPAGCWRPSDYGIIADDGAEDLFSISRQMGYGGSSFPHAEMYATPPPSSPQCSAASSLCYSPDLISIFVNGVVQEVPRRPFDLRALFGTDLMLLHSSGEIVPTNDNGVLFQGLIAGESYFLVPRPTI